MEETQTSEEIQQNISAAFDSVNLINDEIATINNSKDSIKRNYQHLEIMMAKDWFAAGCTEQQILDINTAIALGRSYGV